MNASCKPVVALTLGDPAGIGAELIARLLARPEATQPANVVLVGDPWLWERGQSEAGTSVKTRAVASLAEVRARDHASMPAFLPVDSVAPGAVQLGAARAAGGKSALANLDLCLDAAKRGEIDAICFAPLNKYALKQGGMNHEDELHHFAQSLGVTGYFCEFNTLGQLWTARVSSHIPLKEAAGYL